MKPLYFLIFTKMNGKLTSKQNPAHECWWWPYSSLINLEATDLSSNRWLDKKKKHVVHPYDGAALRDKNKWGIKSQKDVEKL